MIVRKSAGEIEMIRVAGRVVAEVLDALAAGIVPGLTRTADLDRMAAQICERRGAVPAFLGYRGFPACTCISVNEAVVHGIPDGRVLIDGDLVSVDFACSVNGYFADAAVTVPVGAIDAEARRLLTVTREALFKGIAQARIGGRLGDVASAIQRHAERAGYGVVRDLVGHGVGLALHEEPSVPNFGRPHTGERLVQGMTLAIEPMVNQGTYSVRTLDDTWTIVTADGKRSAHFEHTVAVTKRGPDILTLPAAARGAAPGAPVVVSSRDWSDERSGSGIAGAEQAPVGAALHPLAVPLWRG
jgi:methionyl aminopeptidase